MNTVIVVIIAIIASFIGGIVVEDILEPMKRVKRFIGLTGDKISDLGEKISEIDDE